MIRPAPFTAGVTLLAFTTACTIPPAPPPPPEPPTRYYSAIVQVEQTETRAAADDGGVLSQDAAQLLHPGIKVAFYPPNECVSTPSEAGTGGTRELELMLLHCGALMSRLEAQAARARFEVVSWQALKHKDRPPLEVARELGVDVMFEINELSILQRKLGTERATHLRFGQQSGPDDRADLAVGPEVARRCQTALGPEIATAPPMSHEAVLDAKAVEVKTGRSLWFYKRATPEALALSPSRGLALYYPAAGTIDWTPPPPAKPNGMHFGGGTLLLLGFAGATGGAAAFAVGKGDDNPEFTSKGSPLLMTGILAMTAGAVLLSLGNRRQRNTPAPVYPAPSYAAPEGVLCVVPPVVPPWHAAAAGPAAGSASTSASYSLTEVTPGGQDIDRERREKLVRQAADQFIAELGKLSSPN